jgi:hypothetical protein
MLEPTGRQRRIAHGGCNAAVAKVVLDGSGILAVIGQLVAELRSLLGGAGHLRPSINDVYHLIESASHITSNGILNQISTAKRVFPSAVGSQDTRAAFIRRPCELVSAPAVPWVMSLSGPTHRIGKDQDFKGALGTVCLRHRANAYKRARLDVCERRLR